MTDPAALPPAEGEALATLDLSGNGAPETGGQAAGRIIGGLLLMIIGGLATLACLVGFVASWFVPSLQEWTEVIGDGLYFVGAITLGLTVLGFELLRRGRRARANGSAFEATANFLGAAGVADIETIDVTPSQAPPPPKAIL